MDIAQIVLQIASALTLVIAIFQKEKWKMMLLYTINNTVLFAMFLAFGRLATAMISLVGAIRMAIYMIYSLKKLKPNYIWLIVFETAFLVTTILTWQDALDLMPLIALMVSCYGGWQDDQSIMRTSFIINGVLYVIYEIIIGAYIAMAVEAINLVCTIISLIYYCILKKETPILQVIFKRKQKQIENISNSDGNL